ncbi:MAG TPA: FAD-dependent oxidoreductase [Steroidobacter sp.]|jgi:glycine/D-amino acid oxidase-like deaminating enzyme|nr:FAD-dependent oxidoreductase [Steroidobacteraceae bacterium]HLS80832.1 FAD-dependent oxidoreductase [Steroidobacter sp.]
MGSATANGGAPASHSFWRASASAPQYPPLSAQLNVDVCVIGAGLAGLTTAWRLVSQGVSVAVIEALEIGAGETGRTTAHIAIPDEGYAYLERVHGRGAARLVAESFAAAIDSIEATVREESIDCDFERVDGYLYSCSKNPRAALDREFEAASRAGVQVLREAALPTGVFAASIDVGPCLRFTGQAQFHPLKYLAGLAEAVQRRRGVIHTGARALSLEERDDSVVIHTATGRINADAAVVATNTPFNDRVAIHAKQVAWQTYVTAALVPQGAIHRALVWDDAEPYHYVRTHPAGDGEHDVLIVGGADHKTGHESDPEAHYREIETWMRDRFPGIGGPAFRWSGEIMEPLDGLAFIGPNPGSRSVYVISGDSGNGMTHATIGGLLVSDLIMGRQNRWLSVYDPARKPVKEAIEFIKTQSDIAAHYIDWVSGGDVHDAAEIAVGEGAVLRSGLKKYAVFRDDDGALHARSAKCTHLGCVVQWNAAEKTWDCPCHGSRYSAYGAVLHGPAVQPLEAVEEEDWREITPAGAPSSKPQPSDRPPLR